MIKSKSKVKIEIAHAIREESDLVIAITKMGSVYVLGQERESKIATHLGPEWFNGLLPEYERYKENVVENSDPELVKTLNESSLYQNQLWAVVNEAMALNRIEKETQNKNKPKSPPINLDFEVESIA